jgi:hypothetical protein
MPYLISPQTGRDSLSSPPAASALASAATAASVRSDSRGRHPPSSFFLNRSLVRLNISVISSLDFGGSRRH